MVWTHGNEKLESFIAYLNSIHPTITFTSERSSTSIPFLDVKIFLENGKIQTDLYCKPTDKHQYLLHSSSHPYHTKISIPYSLALRLRRICSKDDFFDTRSTELERYLTKRGYKSNFVRSQISRAKSIPRNDILKENSPEIKKPDRVPFVTTYTFQPYLIFTKYYARNNPFSIPQNAYKIFKETPVVAYRRSPNLRDLLVRPKLKNLSTVSQSNHSFGTFRCNSKHGCLTCPHIDNERTKLYI